MPSLPWEYLYGDICGPFPTGEYIFTVTDAYSRYPEAIHLQDTSSKSLIKELESIFSRHGYPLTLKTNNGPNLVSVEMENSLRCKGIHHAKSAIYWPGCNGEVEGYNKTLLKLIRAIHSEGKYWRSYFNSMLLDYRSTKHATTQVVPDILLFNRDIRNHFPLLNKTIKLSHQEKAKRNDTNSKIKSKTRYEKTKNVKISDIKVGGKILVKQRKRNKLTSLYKSEPFTVIGKKGNTVKITDAYGNERVHNVADVRCLRGASGSLLKVQKRAGQDKASDDFIDDTKESRQDQNQGLWRSTRQRRMSAYS